MSLLRRRGILSLGGGGAAPAGAVTVEAVSTWEQTNSGTSLTATAPTATVDDDLLVAFVMARSEVTPPAGWTLIGRHKAAEGSTENIVQEHQLWRKDAVLADADAEFQFQQASASRMALQLLLLRSTSGTFRIEDDSVLFRNVAPATVKTSTAPQVTSPGDGRLAVLFGGCVYGAVGDSPEFTLPAGYTRHSPTTVDLRSYVGTAPVDDGETSPSGSIAHEGNPSLSGSTSHGEGHGVLMIGPDAPDELTIESFTADETWDWAAAGSPATVEVLVVAGGGAGGAMSSGNLVGHGGGGAGGVRYDAAFAVAGDVAVTVGAGGAGTFGGADAAFDGGDSSFGALTAAGGGGAPALDDGRPGGSGGGGRFNGVGGAGTVGQGFDGGDGESSGDQISGGGGGSATSGGDGASGGNGGTGVRYGWAMAYGELGYLAGGGGGGAYDGGLLDEGGFGGRGGGGNGGDEQGAFPAAMPNTGGGGGGAGGSSSSGTTDGGAGGSGIVLVRYPTPTP